MVCNGHDFTKYYMSISSTTLPFVHQRLATLTVGSAQARSPPSIKTETARITVGDREAAGVPLARARESHPIASCVCGDGEPPPPPLNRDRRSGSLGFSQVLCPTAKLIRRKIIVVAPRRERADAGFLSICRATPEKRHFSSPRHLLGRNFWAW